MSNAALRTGGTSRLSFSDLALLAVLVAGFPAAPATAADASFNTYVQRNLVSDGSIPADRTDPKLVAPWGIASSPAGLLWIASNGASASTIYDDEGESLHAPPRLVDIPGGSPTGIVANDGAGFLLPCPDGTAAPSSFIFATEAGILSGWNQRASLIKAIPVVDNSVSGAMYKGVAIAASGTSRFLYATDFRSAKVDVFNSDFHPVRLPAGAFKDPNLPAKFAPFGIQNINGQLYVTYAKQDELKEDSAPGWGRGFINIFEPDGRFVRRLVSRGNLNTPWGMALAPANFGEFGNQLLVANFGDGRINVYNPTTGEFKGQIRGIDNQPLAIDGLWGICFGKGIKSRATNALFFTAGPAYENKGLYGRIEHAESLFAASGSDHIQPRPVQQPLGGTAAGDDETAAGDEDQAPFEPQARGRRVAPADDEEDGGVDSHASKTPD